MVAKVGAVNILYMAVIQVLWDNAWAIDCFKCFSFNKSDPDCGDPFHSAYGEYIKDCSQGQDGHVGLYPAKYCIKLIGNSGTMYTLGTGSEQCFPSYLASDDNRNKHLANPEQIILMNGGSYLYGKRAVIHNIHLITSTDDVEMVYRSCSLESLDSQCGEFRYEGVQYNGCVMSCTEDGCNTTSGLRVNWWTILLSSAVVLIVLISQQYSTNLLSNT